MMLLPLCLVLLGGTSTFAGVISSTAKEQICTFEESYLDQGVASSIGVLSTPLPDGYCGFHWDSFNKGSRVPAVQLLSPIDNGFAVSTKPTSSSLDILYPGSRSKAFGSISVNVGCYVSLRSGVSPAINCKVRVTPSSTEKIKFDPSFEDCSFEIESIVPILNVEFVGVGKGQVQQCKLPKWDGVEKLTFELLPTNFPTLSAVSTLLGGPVASPNFAIDNVRFISQTAS